MDVLKIRGDFPALAQKIGDKPLIYLDSAATTQRPQSVIDTLSEFYQHDNSNVHRGVHTLSQRATVRYEGAREKVRGFLNARYVDEIVFTGGTTAAINLVASSFGKSQVRAGDEIILSEMEHHSNIVPWQMMCEQYGAKLQVVRVTDRGELDLAHFKNLLNSRTRLVALTHVSNVLGTVNPIQEIVELAHRNGAAVLIDGAQAAPHFAVDMQALDCDFYAISSHKMYGPMGVGALYAKREWLERLPPYQGGGSMINRVTFAKTEYARAPTKFEAGTPPVAEAIGFGAAVDYLQAVGLSQAEKFEHTVLEYAQDQLAAIAGLKILGQASKKIGVISFIMDDIHAHDLGTVLDNDGVAVRAGHHCAMPLMERFGVPALVRASLGVYNTREDIDVLVEALKHAKRLFQ